MDYNFGADPIEKAIKEDGATTRSIARAMARVPLGFEPGEDYRYSLSHDVLGAVIEQASGMKLAEYIQKYIFDPLGMKDIGFHPTDEQSKRITAQYRYHNGTNTVEPCETANRYAFSPDYDSGGAGLFSTVTEYMKLVTVLANGGRSKDGYVLLRPETIKMMGENQLSDKGRDTFCKGRFFGYGWGLCGRVHMDPEISFSKSSVGEFGWDGAAGAFTMIDPEKNIAMYFGTHIFGFGYGYNVLHPMLRNLVIEAIEGK
jgi:CubicO group peptidase (beta-lactamase class C family)